MTNAVTEMRRRDRRDAKKPGEITRDEYRAVAGNTKTITEGRTIAAKWLALGKITVRSR